MIIFNFIERTFGPELKNFLLSILTKGIPDLNVPPLDPLVYKEIIKISETDTPGMMK
jgi:hypothetical protein